MTRRLHIGGTVAREGWEVLNANAAPYVDHVGNANDLSRFADNTFEAIYASHVIEHLDYTGELQKSLKDCCRVLVPGGQLLASVPDMDILAGLFLRKDELSLDERFAVMRMLFGGHVDRHDYHAVGLNEAFLGWFLAEAGFVDVQRTAEFGLFEDTSTHRFKGVAISLNLIARKPGSPRK